MNKIRVSILSLGLVVLSIVAISGCSLFNKSSPQSTVTTAFKSETAADAAVTTAMIAWGAYVAQFHPAASQEIQVKSAFLAYQKANLAVIDATTAYANATGSNSVAAAANVSTASTQAATALGNILGLVAQFTIQTNQPAKSP